MVFTEGQQVWFVYKSAVRHKKRHIWKVRPGRVVFDPGKENPIVKIKPQKKKNIVGIRRRYIFDSAERAEAKCEHWNHWDKFHRDHKGRYRGHGKKHK